jgi:NAD-dependent deacetylase
MQTNSPTPEECAARIRAASKLAVLTGAGMSTAAGVPDFRGPKGLYVTRAYDPETVFDIHSFDRDPAPFYKFSRDFLGMLETIRPTGAHRFLADWEKSGRDVAVVTQNIDGLHQQAGSRNVLPLHGDYETAHCRRCGRGYGRARLLELMGEMAIPLCEQCSGVIKPDVVFFGENVRHMTEALRAARESDLMLVLGSSLTVYPAAGLPLEAGGDVLIVNRGEVGMRPANNVSLVDADLDEFFRSVASALL